MHYHSQREYIVAYKPEIRGRHILSLKIGSHKIQGCPFTIFAHYPCLHARAVTNVAETKFMAT